jgi:hypothetical protein
MSNEGDDLKIVATANDEMQAELIMGRLSEAGIHCMGSGGAGFQRGMTRSRDVYVNAKDLDRARAILHADEGGFDEDELARLSEEAGKEIAQEP